MSTFSEVSCGFAESETKGNHEGSASGQDDCFPIMLSKDGASLLLRVRLDKLELRRLHFILLVHLLPQDICLDTFGAKRRFLNRGKKRRSVSTLSIPRASDRGVEWVDFFHVM